MNLNIRTIIREGIKMLYKRFSKLILITVFSLFICFCGAVKSFAMFVNMQEAQNIVENWLLRSKGIILDEMGVGIREIVHYHGDLHGEPGYYMFFLNPSGWVVVPADDSFEVIRAFGGGAITSKDFANSPMPYYLRVDLPPQDTSQFISFGVKDNNNISRQCQQKMRWDFLKEKQVISYSFTGEYLTEISNDIVVSPLLGKNTWGQTDIVGFPFYNASLNWNNKYYVAGCVPLSVAQVMRRFEYPNRALAPGTSIISIDNAPAEKSFIRTDRPYSWPDMPVLIDPLSYGPALSGNPFDVTQQEAELHRDEISVLLHDV